MATQAMLWLCSEHATGESAEALSLGPTVLRTAEAVATAAQQNVNHFLFRKVGWRLSWPFRHEVSYPTPRIRLGAV